jgi:hypothetical protein
MGTLMRCGGWNMGVRTQGVDRYKDWFVLSLLQDRKDCLVINVLRRRERGGLHQ